MKKGDSAQRAFERASKFAQQDLHHRAIPLYEKLVQAFPEELELSLHLAHTLGLSGHRRRAYRIQDKLHADNPQMPEILVRCARDRDLWKDFEGALLLYKQLYEGGSKWKREAVFHCIRLHERLNQVNEAESLLSQAESLGMVDQQWGWSLVRGHLARRSGNSKAALKFYGDAEEAAPRVKKVEAAVEIARIADSMDDFEMAYRAIERVRLYRAEEVDSFQKSQSIFTGHLEQSDATYDEEIGGPIFLVGLPRSGTSLLSKLLEQKFEVCLSEEHNYINQLLKKFQLTGGALPNPKKLKKASRNKVNSALQAYYEAQKQTVGYQTQDAQILLDKNPSLTLLTPWLLELIPNLRVLWIDRSQADVWLSSMMQNLPVNQVTCWWNTARDYDAWAEPIQQLRTNLREYLPSHRFVEVSYASLVDDSASVIDRVAQQFGLIPRQEQKTDQIPARSPSYAQVEKPIERNRLNRWKNYEAFFSEEEQDIVKGWNR